jgi:ElaB/YqjD/DUF883 family membrane-anchored ribosome-binding protein
MNMAIEAGTNQGAGKVASALNDIGIDDPQQVIDNTREIVGQALEQAAEFIRERPLVCLAGAVAVGYLIGKIASR